MCNKGKLTINCRPLIRPQTCDIAPDISTFIPSVAAVSAWVEELAASNDSITPCDKLG